MTGQNPLSYNSRNPSGFIVANSVDAQGNLQTAQGHGDNYAASYAARLFGGASQAGATLSAGLATTYTGLCLSNPAGSGKNLIVQAVSAELIVAPAADLALGLIAGWSAAGVVTHTTPVTAFGTEKIGSATLASIAKLDAACTIVGTPAWLRWMFANSASAGLGGFYVDLKGGIILIPGAYLAIGGNVAGPAAGMLGSFEWEEAPV